MFDPNAFVTELADQIAFHLRQNAANFKTHRLAAIALDAHPWHKGMGLSVLIETDENRKWDIGDWEYQDFADVDGSPLIRQGYDNLQDAQGEGSSRYAPFFRCCAQALCHRAVKAALKSYTLEPDFEVFVADPDDPNEINYCEEVLGVNKRKRKVKTEIVNNLHEALKDPLNVLVLKYWYHDRFTALDGKRIGRLKNLQVLNLASMRLRSLPRCVLSLNKLIELHLNHNQITRLTGLGSLKKLELLSLRDNGLITSGMQKTISTLVSLRRLWIGNCGLTQLPESWQQLERLEEIYLFGNPLSTIPDWLLELPCLKRLGLVDVVDKRTKTQLGKRHPHLEIW